MAPQAAKRDEEPVGVGRAFSPALRRVFRGAEGHFEVRDSAPWTVRGAVFVVAARCLQPRLGV